tara:strand:- start:5434 stop:7554 length:2121 start_codon:yes stop_codon:yes gene_type:complete
MPHIPGHTEDDLQTFLGELYEQGFAGVQQNPMTQTVQVEGGDYQMPTEGFVYSTYDDPTTETDESIKANEAITSWAESQGATYDPEKNTLLYPEGEDVPESFKSEANLEDFLKEQGSLGYCKGGDGTSKETCKGTWVPYYDEDSGMDIFQNKREWLKATYPDLDDEQLAFFDTIQFDQEGFEKVLQQIEETEAKEKSFINTAFQISKEQRDAEQKAIDAQYASGLISLQEAETLKAQIDKAAEEAYLKQIGSGEQLQAIEEALADGDFTESEAKNLFNLYGDEQGTILRDIQRKFESEKQKFLSSEEGVERTTRQKLAQLQLDYDVTGQKELMDLNQNLEKLKFEKEMGSQRAKRDFIQDYTSSQDSLAKASYAIKNFTQGFAGSGVQQEQEEQMQDAASERLGRIVSDTYLPQIENILKSYNLNVGQIQDQYSFKTGSLEKQKDLSSGNLEENREAALETLQQEFGITAKDIGATAQDVLNRTIERQQAGQFQSQAEANQLAEKERTLLARLDEQKAGLLTAQESADLKRDRALFEIEKQTSQSLTGATSLLDNFIADVIQQYDLLPEVDTDDFDDDDDTDDDIVDPEVPDVDPELQRGKDYYQRTYGKDPEDMTDAEFIESIQGKFEEDQASDKALKERMIKEKIDEINNNIKTCQEQLKTGQIRESQYQQCKTQNEARIALIEGSAVIQSTQVSVDYTGGVGG